MGEDVALLMKRKREKTEGQCDALGGDGFRERKERILTSYGLEERRWWRTVSARRRRIIKEKEKNEKKAREDENEPWPTKQPRT